MKTLIAILTLAATVSFTETKATSRSVSATHDTLAAPAVDTKILGKFKKAYPEVSQAMWQPIKDGYTASFKDGDVTMTWVYNTKHNIGYEIKSYDKSSLPAPIAERIAKAYNEYDIESVEEVNVMGKTKYFAWISSNKFRKFIKMDENEIYASETMKKENL